MTVNAEIVRRELSYDPEDGTFRWRVRGIGRPLGRAGTLHANGYRFIKLMGKRLPEHRLAWLYIHGEYPSDDKVIDHINGICSDNRMANLRACSRRENQWNRRTQKNNRLGLKGVAWCGEKNRWRALITVSGKQKLIGYFVDPAEASEAYHVAAKALHGEFYRP